MNKHLFALSVGVLLVIGANAQNTNSSGQNNGQGIIHWKLDGNSANDNHFIGTVNEKPLVFKANSLEGIRLLTDGSIRLEQLKLQPNENTLGLPRVMVIQEDGTLGFLSGQELVQRITLDLPSEVKCDDGPNSDGNYSAVWQPKAGNPAKIIANNVCGPVFIGINTTTPQNPLHVVGNSFFNGSLGIGTANPTSQLHITGFSPTIRFTDNEIQTGTDKLTNFEIRADNGIGRLISDQSVAVFINGDNNESNHSFSVYNNSSFVGGSANRIFSVFESGDAQLTGVFGARELKSGRNGSHIRMFFDGANHIMETEGPGNLLINYYGNKNVSIGGQLSVCRNIVVHNSEWCDYVFDEKYKLRTLYEVEQFIKQNKHLPDMPSEQELIATGIDVEEMFKMHQLKIEEITLYEIQLKKENDELKKENEDIKSLLLLLQQRVEELEKNN
jgi:hypothetical protein